MAEADAGVVRSRKVPKSPRLTFRQEVQVIQNLPRTQRLIVIMKIAGVILVAIGLEGIVTGQLIYAAVFIPLGVFVSMFPIRIRTGHCIACLGLLEADQAICPACGAPQM